MNFIKLIFIIFIISSLNGQAISTPKTIKPLMQIENISSESAVSFIGVEEGEFFQTAKLYDINKENVLMPLEDRFNVQACVQEGCASYFSGGHYGDLTGEGIPEIVLLITNPSYGTQILIWTSQENGSYKMLEKPYLINSKKNSSEAINSFLETVYPDKDNEIIVSIGSPDRKVVILNYDGKISSKTIAGEFLENTVGPLVLKLQDFNNDGLKDIYILNNGRLKEEKVYLSPAHEPSNIKFYNENNLLKDVIFYSSEKETVQINLLQDNTLSIPAWEKTKNIDLQKPVELISIVEETLFVLNEKGDLIEYLINKESKALEQGKIIKNKFNKTGYEIVHSLLLDDSRIILSHDKNPEILLISLKQKTESTGFEKSIKTNTAETEQLKENTIQNQFPPTENDKEKMDLLSSSSTIVKLDQDTIYVNVGEPTAIKLNFNTEYEFLDLEEKTTPKNMSLDVSSLSFMWTPALEDAGYNNLSYLMSYNKNTSLTKVQENGKFKLKKNLEKTQTEHSYVIFVNSPPEIKIEEKNYVIQENKELIVPIYIRDVNTEQRLSLDFKPSEIQKAFIADRKFYWTPNKTNFGKNSIEFIVNDGFVSSYEKISVTVDTTKVIIENEEEFITTVNEEFIHRIALLPETEVEILKGPENLRISKDGTVHWIPTNPELGSHFIQIEIREKEQSSLYNMKVFVNAKPVISYRPDLIEYISLNNNFVFDCRSFDQNINQSLYWALQGPEGMKNNNNTLSWKATIPDYVFYSLLLTDKIDTTTFNGALYVNDIPKIISTPPQYVKLGDTLNYFVVIEDLNKKSAFNMQEPNDHIYYLDTAPNTMKLENNQILWTPGPDDIGPHQIKITVTDGLDPTEQNFTLFVNDQPTITSVNELKIQPGDTLHHFVQAQDANSLSRLTYGINSDIDTMTLNGKTGEIFWTPTEEDIGKHQIEVSVSDGFDLSKDIQTINILVYKNPEFDFEFLPEAYAGSEYNYTLKAHDMFFNTLPEQDIFIEVKETTIKASSLDSLNYNLKMFPTYEEIGNQKITLLLSDTFNNRLEKEFPLKVLTSPCETTDTVYVENQEVVSRLQKIDKSIVYASKNEKINLGSSASAVDTIYITKYDTTITNITDSIFVVVEEKKKEKIKQISNREKRKLARQERRAERQTKKLAKRTKNLNRIAEDKAAIEEKEKKQIAAKESAPPVVKKEHQTINIINKETVVVEKVLLKEEEPEPTIKAPKQVNQIKFSSTNVPVFNDKVLGVKTGPTSSFSTHDFGKKSIKTNQKIEFNIPDFLKQEMYWYIK